MKLFVNVLFFFAAAFVFVECLPRFGEEGPEPVSGEDSDAEDSGEEGLVYSFFPFRIPMLQQLMQTLHDRLRGLTAAGPGPEWGKVTNATSTQKVINGHVVTINETTYTKDGNNTDGIFFVRVIDIKPTENDSVVTPTDSANEEEVASKKSDSSNEISQGQTQDSHHADLLLETREFEPNYDDEVDNSIDIFDTEPVRLDDDILVNKVRHDETKGGIFMVPDDVEVFDVEDGKPIYSYKPYYHPNDFSQRTQKIVT